MPGQGVHAAVAAGLLGLLAAMGGGQAGHVVAEAHVLVIEAVELDIALVPDLAELVISYDLGPSEPVTGTPYCEESVVLIDAAAGSFTFDDNATTDGCAEVRLGVAVPAGAPRLVVQFQTNRLVEQASGNTSTQAILLQQFRIFDEDGTIAHSRDIFAPDSGSHPSPLAVEVMEPLSSQRNVTLSWLFDDQGFQGERLSTLQDFEATVSDIRIQWPAVRLPQPVVVQQPERRANDTVATAEFKATLEVPPVTAPNATAALVVRARHGPALSGVVGPAGPLRTPDVVLLEEGEQSLVTLPPATLLAQGPGTYEFTYVSSRAVAPAQPPPVPSTIFPLYYLMLLLPLPAAVAAIASALGSRRQAEGPYRRIFAGILVVIAVGVLYYAGLVAYAALGVGRNHMAELPLGAVPRLVYAQLAFLFLFFAIAAALAGRYLVRAMRRDIEARRRQEEALRQSNEELERFAYVASHDLQEPLRKVAGFTALLQKRYKGRLDQNADAMIDYAVDGATRMQALIRDILAYSRINSGQLDLQPVDVGAVMDLVATDLDGLIQQHKASLSWRGLPTLRADANQLRQVLQNLVENAIKYRHPKRKPRIEVSAERDGAQWVFRVADNGVGIPKDKADEVFGIFRRLHGREVPGTGIGLAIVKKALERHGGSIRVEPRRGGGSVFIFTLPFG